MFFSFRKSYWTYPLTLTVRACSSVVERRLCKPKVPGSSPGRSTSALLGKAVSTSKSALSFVVYPLQSFRAEVRVVALKTLISVLHEVFKKQA